jgi:hypothetical protein
MLQMVADAGAYSGASAQATAMNTISYFNNIIYSSWKLTEILMLGFTFQFCGVDTAITGAYKAVEKIMSIMIKVTNHGGAAWALLEAEMVTRQNIRDLFPGDGSIKTPLQSFGGLLGSPQSLGMGVSHIVNMKKAWPALFEGFAVVKLKQKSEWEDWFCYTPPYTVRYKNETFDTWYEKANSSQVTRFYWWVTAEPVDALVLPRRAGMPFGFPQVPEMTAVALAKPIGGKIENKKMFSFDGEAKYIAKMIPLSTIKPTFVGLGGGLPRRVEVLH